EPTAPPCGVYTCSLRTRRARVRSGPVRAGAAVEAPSPDPVHVVSEVCASEIGASNAVTAVARISLCIVSSVLNSCGSRHGRLALPGFRKARAQHGRQPARFARNGEPPGKVRPVERHGEEETHGRDRTVDARRL